MKREFLGHPRLRSPNLLYLHTKVRFSYYIQVLCSCQVICTHLYIYICVCVRARAHLHIYLFGITEQRMGTYTHIYIYNYVITSDFIKVYIYIYIERERETKREGSTLLRYDYFSVSIRQSRLFDSFLSYALSAWTESHQLKSKKSLSFFDQFQLNNFFLFNCSPEKKKYRDFWNNFKQFSWISFQSFLRLCTLTCHCLFLLFSDKILHWNLA